jgi:predicted RND superfamily exporter protein/lauroyl/myristoyl acyltransferase
MKRRAAWLWLLLLVPVALGVARLRLAVEVLDLLPADLKVVQGLKMYQQHFANARELIITVRAPDAEQAEAAARDIAESLRKQPQLVAEVTWQPPWLEHPEQAAELIAYLWFNQPSEVFSELTHRLAPNEAAATLAATREQLTTSLSPGEIARASYDPLGLTRLPQGAAPKAFGAAPAFGEGQEIFSSPDGSFRLLFVHASRELATYRDCAAWLNNVKRIVGQNPSGVSLGYTGRPAFVAEVAGGMEHDITISVGGTALIIAVLFWLAHRRWKPMLWLLALLAMILGATLALGGLIFGTINVVSMGFAAILLGLAVDYAVVHYQEALAHPHLSIPEIRRGIAPSIFWAAVTTISAFLVLNFGGLPGLAQLGSLVGVGVGLSACVMIFAFLPPLFPDRWQRKEICSPGSGASGDSHQAASSATERTTPDRAPTWEDRSSARSGVVRSGGGGEMGSSGSANPKREAAKGDHEDHGERDHSAELRVKIVFAITGAAALFCCSVLAVGRPRMDPTANPLRPRNSEAYSTLEQVKACLNQKREPLWLLVSGRTEADVGRRLGELPRLLSGLTPAGSNGTVAEATLPTTLWPRPEFQSANRATALTLAAQRQSLREAARSSGFTESSLALTEQILDTWQLAGSSGGVFWPTNRMSQWIFEKFTARTATNYLALGLVNLGEKSNATVDLSALESKLPQHDVWLSGWELLGGAIFSSVKKNLWKLLLPMVSLVLVSLWLAFRRWAEVLLGLAVLLLSGLCLLATMKLAGWSWNLLNLMALPLVLGTGVDYGIFMQLALRRYHGDLRTAHRSVGRALLLCGATAIAGFGSLTWSSNAGMASLGQVCAVGIAANMLISVFLLPFWWRRLEAKRERGERRREKGEVGAEMGTSSREHPTSNIQHPTSKVGARPSGPSVLYRSGFWSLGLWLARVLSPEICRRLSRLLAGCYWSLARPRREVVIENLLPVLDNDHAAAQRNARALFDQFALKLSDLWRYEAGLPIEELLGEASGWEHFVRAQEQGRGVLLVTPHLGNWEFGGPWLTRRGIALQVVTLAEPDERFTKLRQAARARWNIDTLVVGDDPFAFVEIIRRLEAGATVALLMDRPPAATAIEVELFGRPFAASMAAAELARASGCTLLPVYLPRTATGYAAHVLPAIPYERAALRDREARRRLTQQIMRAFEPVIRTHADQWYHFVPVWPGP